MHTLRQVFCYLMTLYLVEKGCPDVVEMAKQCEQTPLLFVIPNLTNQKLP